MNSDIETVKKRRVFYIPGYDPFHPRRYRELYRKESAEQASISGYSIELSAEQGPGDYAWLVGADIDGHRSQSYVEVLVWSDLVKASMDLNIAQTYLALLRTAWIYVISGALRRLMRLRKGPVIAALYPVGMLTLQLLVAIMVGWTAGSMVAKAVLFVADFPLIARLLGWAVALPIIVVILQWFRKKDNKIFAYYLMHDYAYAAKLKGEDSPQMRVRISEFADRIAAALNTDMDEVLLVGHSSGAQIGVSVLAELIQAGKVPKNGPKLAFLTLGQVVPMVSFLPRAYDLRADLRYLSQRDELTWIDISAPGDGCAFALCDPVAVSGGARDGKRWPLVVSAAFSQTLSEERWNELRWRFFRLHFQYMCAFDNPGDYDYFQITAGPLSLQQRYKDRKPSGSRIDISASPYTSTTR